MKADIAPKAGVNRFFSFYGSFPVNHSEWGCASLIFLLKNPSIAFVLMYMLNYQYKYPAS